MCMIDQLQTCNILLDTVVQGRSDTWGNVGGTVSKKKMARSVRLLMAAQEKTKSQVVA